MTYDTGSHDKMSFFVNRIQHLFAGGYYLIYIYMYLRAVIKTQLLYHEYYPIQNNYTYVVLIT